MSKYRALKNLITEFLERGVIEVDGGEDTATAETFFVLRADAIDVYELHGCIDIQKVLISNNVEPVWFVKIGTRFGEEAAGGDTSTGSNPFTDVFFNIS